MMIKKILMTTFIITFFISCNSPFSSSTTTDLIDVLQEPVQQNINNMEKIPIILKNGTVTMTKKAKYDISAKVVSKEKYSSFLGNWTTEISNFDLALAWGEITQPENSKYITYSQRDRWYYYRYSGESKYKSDYITSHSANTHIIHANNNILKAVKSIDVGEYIRLKGYLVYLDGSIQGNKAWWHSSLSRKDSGDGSCELFYVTSVQIKEKIYE